MLGGGSVAAATTSAAVLPILAAGGGAAAAASTGMTALAALGLSQAVLARVLTSPLATNTLLAAERAYQSGNAAKAAEIIQQSQTIQRIIGQSLARTEPVAQGVAGIEQGE
jgi:predicted membrane-bound mannosyltransferase